MGSEQKRILREQDDDVDAARERFRVALVHSYRTRASSGEVEAAAAHFCQALRRIGYSPERMLVVAKEVIRDAIDDKDLLMAERAVLSCIQHYYRD